MKKFLARGCTLGGIVFSVCACATAPSLTTTAIPLGFELPLVWSGPVNPSNSGSLHRVALNAWWLHFNDPLLSELISQALLANTSVRGAQATLRQSRALARVAHASLWPSLGASASAARKRSNNTNANQLQVGLDASWELDIFGGNLAASRAADANTQSSESALAQVQVSVAAEVALDYMALRSAQERLAIAQANQMNQQETRQLTDWRQQAGLVTSVESAQALAAAEQTAAQVPVLQASIAQLSHALSVLVHQAPAALNRTLSPPQPLPQTTALWMMEFPADTLRQRMDVQAAQFRVIAAMAQVDQAHAARLPSFKLGGSLGLGALTFGALTDGAALAASVLAGLSLPVFDAGASQAQVESQQAALDQAISQYQATVLLALTEVEDALVALQSDRDRLQHLQIAFEAADVAARLARQRYDSGLVDFQTVLETQRTRLTTQDSVALVRAAIGADQIRLIKAWAFSPTC